MRAEIYYKLLVKTHKLVHRLYGNFSMMGQLNAVRNIVYKEQNKLPYIQYYELHLTVPSY